MIAETEIRANKIGRKAKKNTPPKPKRRIVNPAQFYTRREAALALGISPKTIGRAYYSGNLEYSLMGRHIFHTGQQLLNWIAAGGKTSR